MRRDQWASVRSAPKPATFFCIATNGSSVPKAAIDGCGTRAVADGESTRRASRRRRAYDPRFSSLFLEHDLFPKTSSNPRGKPRQLGDRADRLIGGAPATQVEYGPCGEGIFLRGDPTDQACRLLDPQHSTARYLVKDIFSLLFRERHCERSLGERRRYAVDRDVKGGELFGKAFGQGDLRRFRGAVGSIVGIALLARD